ncbi:Crp/Fnr family transcriptional regulator [Prevotella scopos JCM 17725]|jgi:cyclic nucleotide-binding domain protein|uniref:cAMP-binding domain of CRP or a regulatory subunit of cAMP-dependent protein kinases n=1 Tax=Prevotella scopos JCM 17725 TaxID=1236518 RepID=A0AAX2F1D2_9BACT|nr:Crp/Fnr family transcriptional regulator [Prevotella scopos]ANR74238.1 cyclic nucleotide-binding protein [Prevotella scopos JCM 17725]QUB44831.1 Crp/Fnr family transcriptional regulator [Prevotella scopos JCM 17725]SHF59144.1 cAMP-binding domain of CRP or a regulatory subunit of cAMP-dependent protein kinases [Prevotella scopos JCM 17725]
MKDLANNARDIARELARKYSTMTHDELDVLESILVPMKFAKGQMILSEGEVCKHVYYIERGLIRQFYFKNGKQITEHLGEDRSIFMCIESLFREEPTKLQVEALEPTWIYALPKHKLEQVALHNVNIQILYRKILEESLITSQVHADLVRFETAQARYKRMCKLSPQVILRAPLVYIASYLQMTPETLSRVRSSTLLDD